MAELSIPIVVNWDDIKDRMAKSDIVEVVRCKDCKWYDEEDLFCRYWAVLYAHADATPRYSPFDYCFRGERKDGEEK